MSDEVKIVLENHSFTWDDEKEKANIRKHGVTFRLAAEVFMDKSAVNIYDDLHSYDEDRYQIIGTTYGAYRILFVVYVERTVKDNVELYRIISARDANREEKDIYVMGLSGEVSPYEGGSIRDGNVSKGRGY